MTLDYSSVDQSTGNILGRWVHLDVDQSTGNILGRWVRLDADQSACHVKRRACDIKFPCREKIKDKASVEEEPEHMVYIWYPEEEKNTVLVIKAKRITGAFTGYQVIIIPGLSFCKKKILIIQE